MDTSVKCASALALAAILTAAACGGSPSGPSGSAGLNLRITDSPYTDAAAVLVTLSGVRIHSDEEGWMDVALAGGVASLTCDLKMLEGPEALLGADPTLPAGRYTQIRLVVTSAEMYDEAAGGTACAPTPVGEGKDVEIPSGEVKIPQPFDLEDGETTTIVLDFVGDESIKIHPTGNGRHIMTPVIRVKRMTTE